MGLRDEWEELRGAAARVAADALRLTTVTTRCAGADASGERSVSIRSDAQLDSDTATTVQGDAQGLEECHRAALDFTRDLAEARLRMLAKVASALLL